MAEILTSYVYMDLRLATLKAVSFYLLHNVSTLNQCIMFSCVTVVCKHFSSYQGYPNYRWVLTLSLLMSYIYGAPCKARNFNVIYIYIYMDLRLAGDLLGPRISAGRLEHKIRSPATGSPTPDRPVRGLVTVLTELQSVEY
jgi:hypothetical protein